ncbi:hypothetical protein ACFX11_036078 [Malus domestica]
MNIQARDGFGKYLGIQADFGHSKKAVFKSVRRGMESRIDGWAEQFLSPAGKEVLIKSVAMAMPNHVMACFKLPVTLCKEMERVIAHFFWRNQPNTRGCYWVAWDKLTESKKMGRLGFRDLVGFNLAMLAKIGWRVMDKPESMLSMVLRDKYFPHSSFEEARQQKNSSWGWKGILLGRQIMLWGLRWRVGNGETVRVADPWVPKPHSFKPVLRSLDPNTRVCELMTVDRQGWNLEALERGVAPEDMVLIRAIPFSRYGCADKRIWHYTKTGVYTVRSGYHVAMDMMKNGEFGRKGRGMSSSMGSLGGVVEDDLASRCSAKAPVFYVEGW